MKERKFKVFDEDQYRVIKQVFLISDFKNQEYTTGYFIYERKFSKNYRMHEVPEEKRDFEYRLTYPKQEYFPSDNLDNLILQSVKTAYPKSRVFNRIYCCTLDEENLERMRDRPHEKSEILFRPDFSSIDLLDLIGKELSVRYVDVNIYCDASSELIKNIAFVCYHPYNDTSIVEDLKTARFY